MEEAFSRLSLAASEEQKSVSTEKQNLREQVWSLLESRRCLMPYPPSCFGKIPNYRGNNYAADRVTRLREFKSAKVVKVNPSLAQMSLRLEIMKANKVLVVPSPSLAPMEGTSVEAHTTVFCYMLDGSKMTDKEKKQAMTKKGSIRHGKALTIDWSKCCHIDVVVVGAVAVAPSGRRLGKGHGYAELEWAILYELGVVDQTTTVITTIHENQLVHDAEFSNRLQETHDLPVDIIITPRRIINVRPKLAKPACGVIWEKLSQDQLDAISILKILRDKNG
jgi:5-formyltetrahydrofolate cyclo-ligase